MLRGIRRLEPKLGLLSEIQRHHAHPQGREMVCVVRPALPCLGVESPIFRRLLVTTEGQCTKVCDTKWRRQGEVD